MEEGKMPLLGDKFPEMEVTTTHGTLKLPDEFKGRWFILFSHPADFTPVCTTEFVAFQDRWDDFEKLNCGLIGLSIDQVFSHIKWVEWIKDNLDRDIKFPVIADDTGIVAKKLGIIHPGKGTTTVRAVFVVDDKGVLRTVLYYPQELGRNMDEIVRIVKGLQLNSDRGLAVPANWPNNELIKDRVIIPPAKDYDTAMERRKNKDCYDWWFCHRAP